MDFTAILAIAGTVIVNAVGWTYTLVKSSRQQGFYEGNSNQNLKSMSNDINNLPCVKDPEFVGSLKEHIKGIDDKLDRIEKAVNNKG